MRIRALYFAAARDLSAVKGESVLLPEGTTVAGLLAEVVRLQAVPQVQTHSATA